MLKKHLINLLKRNARAYRAMRSCYQKCHHGAATIARLIRQGSYMTRKYFVLEDKKLIYVSNCKVASTSIKASLTGIAEADCHQAVNRAVRVDERYIDNLPRDAYPDCFRFTFVRSPFHRILSCYKNKYHTDAIRREDGSVGRLYQEGLYFDRYLLGYFQKDRGFPEFVRRVSRIPDFLADRHFVSQHYMLTLNGACVADFVGRMEDLPGAFEPIREKYDLAPLPHTNKTHKRDLTEFYDYATAKLVSERYRADIEAYGYQDEADALLAALAEKEGVPEVCAE